jgi:hypothetical protein
LKKHEKKKGKVGEKIKKCKKEEKVKKNKREMHCGFHCNPQ